MYEYHCQEKINDLSVRCSIKSRSISSSFKRLLNYELQCILFGLSLGAHSLGSNGPFYNSFFLWESQKATA